MSKMKWLFLIVLIAILSAFIFFKDSGKDSGKEREVAPKAAEVNEEQRPKVSDDTLRRIVLEQAKSVGRAEGKKDILKEIREKNCYHDVETGETYAYAGSGTGYVECVATIGKGITEQIVRSLEELAQEARNRVGMP